MEYFFSLRCDKPKIHTTLEEQASISFDWLNSRVATLYMLAQVVVNGEVLLKWFNAFGRETPTCTEIKARFNVASPILIYAFDLQVAVLELNDTVKILQGEKVKDKKARNSRIPTDCKYFLIKMQFIPLRFPICLLNILRSDSSLRLFATTSNLRSEFAQVEAAQTAGDFRALISDFLTAERRSRGTRRAHCQDHGFGFAHSVVQYYLLPSFQAWFSRDRARAQEHHQDQERETDKGQGLMN